MHLKPRARDGYYLIHWVDEDGTRHRISTGTRGRAAAERSLREFRGRVEREKIPVSRLFAELDELRQTVVSLSRENEALKAGLERLQSL